jgi:hypothetical protein
MGNSGNSPERDGVRADRGMHDKFLELCALSTSGELSAEEQSALRTHLAECSECCEALKQFEAAATVGVPLLHSELSGADSSFAPDAASEQVPDIQSTPPADLQSRKTGETALQGRELAPLAGNGHRRLNVNWNYVWIPFAAAAVLTMAFVIYSYRFGKHAGQQVAVAQVNGTELQDDSKLEALEQRLSDVGHDREVLKAELIQRDATIVDLRRQMAEQSTALAELKKTADSLEQSAQSDKVQSQQIMQEHSNLAQKVEVAEASLQKTQLELDALRQKRSEDQSRAQSLEAQIRDLHGQLSDQEQTIGRQQELLAHDRDIRDLMGARDLYIAEVYDIARDGHTQKPYGRVFYTKGKSLIFYAYDLDQESGARIASTFQAWGSRGPDRQQATNLGVFYQDNNGKKRWVLKFDDPKKLEEIDAVFVTVEPTGGSHKPSGRPLLFAYLKVAPNHP